jgi:hypothetical protein
VGLLAAGRDEGVGQDGCAPRFVEERLADHEQLVADRDAPLGLPVPTGAVVEEPAEEALTGVPLLLEHRVVEVAGHHVGTGQADGHGTGAVDHVEGVQRVGRRLDLVPLAIGLGVRAGVAVGVGGGDGPRVGPLLLQLVVPPDRRRAGALAVQRRRRPGSSLDLVASGEHRRGRGRGQVRVGTSPSVDQDRRQGQAEPHRQHCGRGAGGHGTPPCRRVVRCPACALG